MGSKEILDAAMKKYVETILDKRMEKEIEKAIERFVERLPSILDKYFEQGVLP